MATKKLEELNLLDDFLFTALLTYPELGEEFCRKILKVILNRDLGKITITPQKVLPGINTDKRGARLDVSITESGKESYGTIYDIEPNLTKKDKAVLPKRMRFYRAKMDGEALKSGEGYRYLKTTYAIIITPYDPFEEGRMIYTVKNMCVELPEMPYEDGSRTIYLYTKGTKGNPPKELQELMRYMEDTKAEMAVNKTLRDIQQMVEKVKFDGEVSVGYMKVFEREEMIREEGFESGQLKERENGIRLLIASFQEFGVSREIALAKVQEKYKLTAEEAEESMKKCWD